MDTLIRVSCRQHVCVREVERMPLFQTVSRITLSRLLFANTYVVACVHVPSLFFSLRIGFGLFIAQVSFDSFRNVYWRNALRVQQA